MAEKNSTLVRSSRYVAGGTTEVNATAIEWWDRAELTSTNDGQYYVVDNAFAGRLDQIATLFYNEPRYWWYLAQLNNILDPYNEVYEGVILWIPSKSIVDDQMSGAVGGIESKREVPITILPIV